MAASLVNLFRIQPDNLAGTEHVILHSIFNFFLARACREIQNAVQSINLENVSVRSGRWTRSLIRRFAARALTVNTRRLLAPFYLASLWVNVPENPVIPSPPRSVRVIHDKHE